LSVANFDNSLATVPTNDDIHGKEIAANAFGTFFDDFWDLLVYRCGEWFAADDKVAFLRCRDEVFHATNANTAFYAASKLFHFRNNGDDRADR
jgi:hypothetical protein